MTKEGITKIISIFIFEIQLIIIIIVLLSSSPLLSSSS